MVVGTLCTSFIYSFTVLLHGLSKCVLTDFALIVNEAEKMKVYIGMGLIFKRSFKRKIGVSQSQREP